MAGEPLTLNGIRAISVKILIPWRGAWVADVTLDSEAIEAIVPILNAETPAILIIGDKILSGTIDPRGSGTFVDRATARVVGGRGGWDKTVPPQHFYNPGGALTTTLVYLATGGLVGEVTADPIPQVLGEHYARVGGPASRVFGDRDWHVDPITGVTTTAPWVSLPADPTATQVTDWDASSQRATLTSDSLIFPGTILIDARFNGSAPVIRDLEATFNADGSSIEAWCADSFHGRLDYALRNMCFEWGKAAQNATYVYRFVIAVGDKLALQGITPNAPDLNPIEQWSGMSGVISKLLPGTEIVVGFYGSDFSNPYLVSCSPLALPLEVDIGGGATPVVPSPWAVGVASAFAAYNAGIAAAGATPPVTLPSIATFCAAIITLTATLQTALAALPPPATLILKAT